MSSAPSIQGHCDRRFAGVRAAFADNFERRHEIGAAVAVVVAGELVVDLGAGHADLARTRPWERDTIANVYSCTKGMVAICAHRLIEEGRLDLDAPVADYWPEFAQAGKERLPGRWLLSDRAEQAAREEVRLGEALLDGDALCAARAARVSVWPVRA